MNSQLKDGILGDAKSLPANFEKNVKLDVVGTKESNISLKFESIEDAEDEKLDVVMGDISTCSDDLIPEEVVLDNSKHHPLSVLTNLEIFDRKPSIKVAGFVLERATSEPILSDPPISSASRAKSEPVKIDNRQHSTKHEEEANDVIPPEYVNPKQEPSSDGNSPEYKGSNNDLKFSDERKPKIKQERTMTGTFDSPINVDSDDDQDGDAPLVLEHRPTPRYETNNHISNFAITTATELSEPVELVDNDDSSRMDTEVTDTQTTSGTIINAAQAEPRIDDAPPSPELDAELLSPPATGISRNSEGVPPTKRRRVLFDAVVLQKLSSFKGIGQSPVVNIKAEPTDITKVFVKPEPVSEDDRVKLEFLRSNPDVKIKKEAVLGDAGVAYRLHALGPNALDPYLINLEDKIKLASVTRAWMSDTYGGNRQAGCPEIDTKKFKHGIDNFWYMTYEFNANAPRKPGAPGLMFGCWGDEQRVYRNQRVIMRTKQPWWTPMGIYESVPSNPLSQEEWSAQSPSFQNHWAKQLSFKIWGTSLRVRVGLRDSLGREPTAQECESARQTGLYKKISPDLIKEAFTLGQEQISVWTMKCVGYDTKFQHDIAKMPKNYVSPNNNKKGKVQNQGKGKVVKKEPKAPKVKAVAKKRKHQEIESSSDEEGEDDDEDEEGPWGRNDFTRELSIEF